jgi:hypothetical protein
MPKSSQKIGEANYKTAVFQEYFGTKKFAYMQELDRIDFIITDNLDCHLIWAETKKDTADIVEMFIQLILTIGKARTFDRYNPPPFLCVFDYEKIAFLQYHIVHDIFYQTDFNWNITPSDHKSKEFKQIKSIVEKTIEEKNMLFYFENEKQLIKEFIKYNFTSSLDLYPELFTRLQIDKNNFIPTYNRWLEMVKPSIAIDWNLAKKKGIIDGDFYLADLLSEDNVTLKEKLFVLLKKTNYEMDRQIDEMGLYSIKPVLFKDYGKSHRHFWELYIRPPKEEYWDYIVDRRDLLVPQDIRERKGSFFTPQIWVQKSQEYLTKSFGENWQDEYYVWDCAAGTGNLLVGLTNKYNLWASTLDRQDVDVMNDRIKNGANLLESHVFQFDFLNDEFDKLPKGLKEIIDDPEKQKKLIIYINPPYAENGAGSGKGASKAGVASDNRTYHKYPIALGKAARELFAQFFIRIKKEIGSCKLCSFSKMKYINSQNFTNFRHFFHANFKYGFVCPADTFDNVNGKFPIGLIIWDLESDEKFEKIECDVINADGKEIGTKKFFSNDHDKYINDWISSIKPSGDVLGNLFYNSNDFQHQKYTYFSLSSYAKSISKFQITENSLINASIYFSARLVIPMDWLNDRDQFIYPKDNYLSDTEFGYNSLIFALFHGQNRISANDGINHWIPYTADDVNAKDNFQSSFMSNYLKDKEFSKEAVDTIQSGKEIWKYYHSKIENNRTTIIDASFYDIREFFQGRSSKGTMNPSSNDETYNALIKALRQNLSALAEKIKPKVYEYRFLIE